MKRVSCQYNIDTACVEIKYGNGVTISIDCIAVENEIPRNLYERSALDFLIPEYNSLRTSALIVRCSGQR